jgi:hypothetical protein
MQAASRSGTQGGWGRRAREVIGRCAAAGPHQCKRGDGVCIAQETKIKGERACLSSRWCHARLVVVVAAKSHRLHPRVLSCRERDEHRPAAACLRGPVAEDLVAASPPAGSRAAMERTRAGTASRSASGRKAA